MKSLVGALAAACLLGLAVSSARAELCGACAGLSFTADTGTCAACGATTGSGAKKLCPACSAKLGECEACRAKLAPPATPAARDADVELDQTINGKTVEAPTGTSIQVSLKGNITTGYAWSVTKLEGDAVKRDGKVKYVSAATPRNALGVGGTFVAAFTAEKEGATVLAMGYFRPWEQNVPPAETFTVTLKVKAAEKK